MNVVVKSFWIYDVSPAQSPHYYRQRFKVSSNFLHVEYDIYILYMCFLLFCPAKFPKYKTMTYKECLEIV